MAYVATATIVMAICYTFFLFVLSRRRRVFLGAPSKDLFFVSIVPCCNEEVVIGQTLDRLLTSKVSGFRGFAVLVPDVLKGLAAPTPKVPPKATEETPCVWNAAAFVAALKNVAVDDPDVLRTPLPAVAD